MQNHKYLHTNLESLNAVGDPSGSKLRHHQDVQAPPQTP